MYTLQFDGLFREVPDGDRANSHMGFLCYGWILRTGEQAIARGHGAYARGRDANSNVAEYLALIEGLETLSDLGIRAERLRICGDAKGVIDQMQGRAAVSSPSSRPLFRRAKRLADRFQRLEWAWVPRKHNRAADLLTRRAMRQVCQDNRHYQEALQAIHLFNGKERLSGRLLPLLGLSVILPVLPAIAGTD
jgi:ribonuclease HI